MRRLSEPAHLSLRPHRLTSPQAQTWLSSISQGACYTAKDPRNETGGADATDQRGTRRRSPVRVSSATEKGEGQSGHASRGERAKKRQEAPGRARKRIAGVYGKEKGRDERRREEGRVSSAPEKNRRAQALMINRRPSGMNPRGQTSSRNFSELVTERGISEN